MQQQTRRPVQFEITEQPRESLKCWIEQAKLRSDQYIFPSRIHGSPHLSTRQYARIVEHWPIAASFSVQQYRIVQSFHVGPVGLLAADKR